MLAVKSNYAAEHQQVPQQRREPFVRTSTRSSRAVLIDKLSIVGCIAVIVAVFWVLATNSAQVTVMNHSVATLQTQVSKVSAQNAALTVKVDELKRPSRILSIATKQLHMKYENPVDITTSPSISK